MMKKITYILPIAAAALILAFFLEFAASTKAYGPSGAGAGSDAIVVLTGGRGRTDEGLVLLRRGRAKLLILSGVHQDSDHDSIFLKRINSVERGKIVLEKRSGLDLRERARGERRSWRRTGSPRWC